MPQALAVIGAVASVGGTLASVNQQKKSARLQQQQQDLATRRSQRQAIREAQIRRAQAQAAAQGLGVSGGSSIAGGVTSLGSQAGSALGFSTQMSGLSSGITMANAKAQTFGAVASLGGTAFSLGTQMGGLDSFFNRGPTSATNTASGLSSTGGR